MINALFVCIGNSCRSQMAEGFARKYGRDVLHAWSAGLAPAAIVQPLTIQVMSKKNVDIQDQFPKSVSELELDAFDVIFNMSGMLLPTIIRCELRVWNVVDPMTQSEEVYLKVCDQIEGLVMQYILQLRRSGRKAVASGDGRHPRSTNATAPLPKPVPLPTGVPLPNAELPKGRKASAEPANPHHTAGQSSQHFRFGRVRKARD